VFLAEPLKGATGQALHFNRIGPRERRAFAAVLARDTTAGSKRRCGARQGEANDASQATYQNGPHSLGATNPAAYPTPIARQRVQDHLGPNQIPIRLQPHSDFGGGLATRAARSGGMDAQLMVVTPVALSTFAHSSFIVAMKEANSAGLVSFGLPPSLMMPAFT
jgi:hypothetical protein